MSEDGKLLRAAFHALRSYQFGNGSTELAKSTADAIEERLRRAHPALAPGHVGEIPVGARFRLGLSKRLRPPE